MINQSGSDLIRDYGPWPSSSSSSPSSSSYSHSSGSASVSNVGIHCSKTEELTCCPFMLKLWLLIVKLCDGCLPLWWVSVHIWMAVCSLWKQDILFIPLLSVPEYTKNYNKIYDPHCTYHQLNLVLWFNNNIKHICTYVLTKKYITWMYCKSLWIKASAKCKM